MVINPRFIKIKDGFLFIKLSIRHRIHSFWELFSFCSKASVMKDAADSSMWPWVATAVSRCPLRNCNTWRNIYDLQREGKIVYVKAWGTKWTLENVSGIGAVSYFQSPPREANKSFNDILNKITQRILVCFFSAYNFLFSSHENVVHIHFTKRGN